MRDLKREMDALITSQGATETRLLLGVLLVLLLLRGLAGHPARLAADCMA